MGIIDKIESTLHIGEHRHDSPHNKHTDDSIGAASHTKSDSKHETLVSSTDPVTTSPGRAASFPHVDAPLAPRDDATTASLRRHDTAPVKATEERVPAEHSTGDTADPQTTAASTLGSADHPTGLDGSQNPTTHISQGDNELRPVMGSQITPHETHLPIIDTDHVSIDHASHAASVAAGHEFKKDASATSHLGQPEVDTTGSTATSVSHLGTADTAGAETAHHTATPATTHHDQLHESVDFKPNLENPSAIPTAGGKDIGAGLVDHNATGTIGKNIGE